MFAMAALGGGEILGAILMGFIVDRIGPKKASLVNVVFVIIQTAIVIVYISYGEYNILAYVMTFMWGVQDSSISIHLDAILGFQFDTNKEPFSIDAMLEAIS